MEEIKAILFDIGNVILFEEGRKTRNAVAKKFGIDEEAFKEFAMRNLKFSLKGKLHANDFFKKLLKETNVKANPNDLVKEWVKVRNKTSKPNKKVIDLLKPLSKKYKIGCITNSTFLNDKAKQRKYAYSLFKIKFLSNELGYMKPEKEIYQIALKKLKLKPQEILVIDDVEDKLEGAKKLKFKTLLADNNLDKNLRKLL